ncbi:serine hydrolase domain-containing protein [Chitinophaga arvensicola]|uniref:CubicO group peptidase, beta-lactamase class C family n=1 Tax=Chitinophaga arvensicola TaxID=29529 RepID=A0A1I0QR31_9BACT|nr:serine hydrolase [Chitinophaga arvensicola]SEW29966.1 CubicO group peptidase, beta-lactamase class C family [Chitinophaga arvensicola]
MNSLAYWSRCLIRNVPQITDYRHFPNAVISKGAAVRHFEDARSGWKDRMLTSSWRGQSQEVALSALLAKTGSTACIVMQRDRILLESYFNGYTADAINTSFSVAKSMTSVLMGVALEEGAVGSIQDTVASYIPFFDSAGFRDITIAQLLQMCSGLEYREGITPWSDDARIYYGTALRQQALKAKLIETPGSTYHYNNYNLLLLGMILEKATGQPVPDYFREKLWQYTGAAANASWSMDSRDAGFAKMESGFNATAMDFLRFGALCLDNGRVNGRQVVPAAWIQESVSPPEQPADTEKYKSRLSPPLCRWAGSAAGYYKYLWWGYRIDPHNFDYFALGAKGQFIYICPRKQAVIVRFGKHWGKIDWWPGVLKQIADSLD